MRNIDFLVHLHSIYIRIYMHRTLILIIKTGFQIFEFHGETFPGVFYMQ